MNSLSSCHHTHLIPALEHDHQPVIVDRDLLDQFPDQSLIVLFDLLLLSIQEFLDHLHLLPDTFLLGILQEQLLFLFPERDRGRLMRK